MVFKSHLAKNFIGYTAREIGLLCLWQFEKSVVKYASNAYQWPAKHVRALLTFKQLRKVCCRWASYMARYNVLEIYVNYNVPWRRRQLRLRNEVIYWTRNTSYRVELYAAIHNYIEPRRLNRAARAYMPLSLFALCRWLFCQLWQNCRVS